MRCLLPLPKHFRNAESRYRSVIFSPTTSDARLPVAGLRVAVQEYGQPVPELTDGLEQRGAVVTRVPVYRWALPEDTGPLRAALAGIVERRIGVALFTAAQQVEHVEELDGGCALEEARQQRPEERGGRDHGGQRRPERRHPELRGEAQQPHRPYGRSR